MCNKLLFKYQTSTLTMLKLMQDLFSHDIFMCQWHLLSRTCLCETELICLKHTLWFYFIFFLSLHLQCGEMPLINGGTFPLFTSYKVVSALTLWCFALERQTSLCTEFLAYVYVFWGGCLNLKQTVYFQTKAKHSAGETKQKNANKTVAMHCKHSAPSCCVTENPPITQIHMCA